MRTISNLQGLAFWDINWDEFRPLYGTAAMVPVHRLQAEFSSMTGQHSAASQQAGFLTPHIVGGEMNVEGRTLSVNSIEFQTTKLIVSSGSTEDAELIAQRAVDILISELSFRQFSSHEKSYVNIAVVDYDFDIISTLGKWSDVQNLFKENSNPAVNLLTPISLRFAAPNHSAEGSFTFEQRVPRPEGTNWIFSQAPMKTVDHLELLNKIGELFQNS